MKIIQDDKVREGDFNDHSKFKQSLNLQSGTTLIDHSFYPQQQGEDHVLDILSA